MEKEISAQLQQGLTFHRAGQFEQASAVYSEIVKLDSKNFDALQLLGTIAAQTQQYEKAVELLTQALSVNQKNATVYTNLGNALKELNRFDEALASYADAIALDPQDAETFSNLGASLVELDRVNEALSYFQKAITIKPDYAEAFYNQGVALKKLNLLDQAVSSYERAIAILPNYAQAHSNLGFVLQKLNHLDKAIEHFEHAIAVQPDFAEAYLNLGYAQLALGLIHQAIANFGHATAIQPDYADAHWNKSLAHLQLGEFQQGWALYEWRWKREEFVPQQRHFSQPLWQGTQNIAGQTLLLHSEQGLGDSIQFCRYAQHIQNLGARLILEAPKPLLSLFSTLAGVDVLVEQGQPLPDFDYHCPLLSLPLALQTTLDSIPSPTPYLFSSAHQREQWRQRLGHPTKPRIGLTWRGNTEHKNDLNRSLSLQALWPHLPTSYDYVSLQKELRADDQAVLKTTQIQHFGGQLADFSDTAALCDLMDIVISVDTSVAHLVGALGKKTWVLLPYAPDWRWLLNRADSPWYASMKLYRQGPDRQYGPVLARIAQDLV